MSKLLRKLDLFGSEFKFNVSKNVEKQNTTLGSFFSIAVALVSLAYLGFLIIEFITIATPPTVSSEVIINTGQTEVSFPDYSPIYVHAHHPQQFHEGPDTYFEEGNLVLCSDEYSNKKHADGLPFYRRTEYCLPKGKTDLIQNHLDPSKERIIYISITYCDTGISTCIFTPTQAHELLADKDTIFELMILKEQIDVLTGEIKDTIEVMDVVLDPGIVQKQHVDVERTIATIDSGIIIPQNKEYQFIGKHNSYSNFLNEPFYEEKYAGNALQHALYICSVGLMKTDTVEIVVHKKLTVLLAQFTSFFNVLLAIGFIGFLVSDAKIFEKVLNIILARSYKQTAADIIKQREKQKLIKQNSYDQYDDNDEEKFLIRRQNYVNDIVDNDNLNVLQLSDFKSLKLKLLATNLKKKMEHLSLEDQAYVDLNDQVEDYFSFQLLYEQIFSLRSQVQMLYTQSQYAALSCCGTSIPYQVKNMQPHELNHLEKIEKIEIDKEIRKQQIFKFLEEYEKDPDGQSEIDVRIYQSLLRDLKKKDVARQGSEESRKVDDSGEYYDDIEQMPKQLPRIERKHSVLQSFERKSSKSNSKQIEKINTLKEQNGDMSTPNSTQFLKTDYIQSTGKKTRSQVYPE